MVNKSIWRKAELHLAQADANMTALIKKHGPCPLQPRKDYFTQLCKSIISQQLATKVAAVIFARFTEYYDQLPSPAGVVATPREKLREIGLSAQKITYISDLAAHALDGKLLFEQFDNMSDGNIIQELVAIKGIGIWTAQMFLIFALNRPDVLATDDFGLRKAVMLLYGFNAMPGKAEMETVAKPWRPWCSIASWYLWRSLGNS